MTSCIVCGTTAAAPAGTRPDLVRCGGCGLVYNPDASEDRSEFSSSYYNSGVYVDYDGDRAAIARSGHRRLRALEERTSGRRLLDIGCASGFFLDVARQRGWNATGLELSPYAADRARRLGFTVVEGSIVNPPAMGTFDVVTMWDTIEHLAEPDVALRHVAGLLEPGGIVALSTGDCASFAARVLGRRWRLFSDPTHKYFFDQHTLGTLLTSAGLRTVAVGRPGKWVSAAMILHQIGSAAAERASRQLVRWKFNPSFYVNLRDVMTVVAVRDPSGS